VFNGSENVRAGTWDAFFEAFGGAGLRAECHSPGYGLAEATLAVTNFVDDDAVPVVIDIDRSALGQGVVQPCDAVHPDAVRLVTCGVPIADVEVRIVDPHSCEELGTDLVGEVWVRGPNVADGYWRKPERSAATFGARLADGRGELLPGRWLRTGDLGFFHNGLFYVAGRIKDLIIIDGRNHYPADIESTVEHAHEAVRPGGAAAFAIDTGSAEALVVVVEARPPLARPAGEALVAAIHEAVSVRHQLAVHEVVVVRPGGIPRTTSRKVQRSACRDQYTRGLLVSQVGAR
jgi:acyl-CoA synthetase (AMP-forming)/AMP-acid ligase II